MRMSAVQTLEAILAASILIALALSTGGLLEWIGGLAVFTGFLHLQVQEEARGFAPLATSVRFYILMVAREILWISYFLLAGTYAAIIGSILFLAFPLWRRWLYRTVEF